MIENYKPTYIVEAVYQLTPDMLKNKGIKAVLVDLDNTLIAWNNPLGTPEMRAWLEDMKKANMPVVVVSNNKYPRIKKAVEPFGIDFVSRAIKPFTRGMNIAKKRLNLQPQEMIMVGDQLMTDIRGANRAGIPSVLVKPLVESDAWITKFNRARERRVMKKLVAKYDMSYKKGI
ncbi:MAG: YqeG family HAD IIIA-type phosphatase [Streptococcaceae bacterium]|jgi:HAD superfamily phosphatase (TIGR01668 family)|nr:YqeG family HAD IIIA-type phosphatase [Streptococcaceae bacterium]